MPPPAAFRSDVLAGLSTRPRAIPARWFYDRRGSELFEAIKEGDKRAIATFEHCLQVWSALTVALIHAYDPEVVVYGGSVLKRADEILPGLQEYVDRHAWTCGRKVPLRCAALGSDAALLGAIPLMENAL